MEVTMDCESITLAPKGLKSTHLKKHIAAIHSANSLSLLQRKISNALLFFAFPYLKERNEHQITIGQLCQFIGYNSRDYDSVKDALRALLTTLIEWNIVDEQVGEEDWTASTYLASINIKGAVCTYEYSSRLRDLLSYPSVYGKINLVVQSRFKSAYGLALYENCARYQGMPHTKWFDLDLFKKLMGVPASNYAQFCDFKKRVLDKAIDEVNMHSDLLISPEYEYSRRAVRKVRFFIKERPKKNRLGPSSEQTQPDLNESQLCQQLIKEFSLNDKTIKQLLDEYGHEKIKEKIELIKNSKNYKQGRVPSLAGYLIDSLRKDYQPISSAQPKISVPKMFNLKEQKIREEYERYVVEQVLIVFNGLDELIKKEIEAQFNVFMQQYIVLVKLYEESGISAVKKEFSVFVQERHPNLLTKIITFEQYALAFVA